MKIYKKTFLNKKRMGKSGIKSLMKNVENEIDIMQKLDHPNILKIYEVIDDPSHEKLYLGRILFI